MQTSELIDTLFRVGALKGESATAPLDVETLLEDPIVTNRVVVEGIHLLPRETRLDAVVSLAEDQLLAFSTATAAWARFGFFEEADGDLVAHHGFTVEPHQKVLVVASELEEGTKVARLLQILDELEADVQGVMALRCAAPDCVDAPILALLEA